MIGESIDLRDLYRFLGDQEQRAARHRDDVEIYQRDPNKVKALSRRMVEGISQRERRRALVDKVAPIWAKEA